MRDLTNDCAASRASRAAPVTTVNAPIRSAAPPDTSLGASVRAAESTPRRSRAGIFAATRSRLVVNDLRASAVRAPATGVHRAAASQASTVVVTVGRPERNSRTSAVEEAAGTAPCCTERTTCSPCARTCSALLKSTTMRTSRSAASQVVRRLRSHDIEASLVDRVLRAGRVGSHVQCPSPWRARGHDRDAQSRMSLRQCGERRRDPSRHNRRIDDDGNQRDVSHLPRRIRHRA